MTPSPSPRKSVPVEGLGSKLRVLRKDRGLTQADLATSIGIQQSDLCRMETGEYKGSLETLFKILMTFEMDFSEFFHEASKSQLDIGEMEMLRNFRSLSPSVQQQVCDFIRFMERQSRGTYRKR